MHRSRRPDDRDPRRESPVGDLEVAAAARRRLVDPGMATRELPGSATRLQPPNLEADAGAVNRPLELAVDHGRSAIRRTQ